MRNATVPAILLLLGTMGAACAHDSRPGTIGRVSTDGVELAYRMFGPASGEPILFIQGVGGTMPEEPDGFLRRLMDEGYRIIVFDNRDTGLSTHLDNAGAPDFEAIGVAISTGEPAPLPYTLRDMADDALAVLEALSVERAHLVGGSAGGMIAQLIAAEHPGRVASLSLISSTTNNPELPTGDASQPEADLPDNLLRQGLASGFAGDLRDAAARIAAPTVVIHGSEDEIFPPAHGRDLAATVPDAVLTIIDGMGHVPEEAHSDEIARLIEEATSRARAAGEAP